MNVGSYSQELGGLRTGSNVMGQLQKATEDRLAMLDAQKPDDDPTGIVSGTLGALGDASRFASGVGEFMDKVKEAGTAVGSAVEGVASAVSGISQAVSGGRATTPEPTESGSRIAVNPNYRALEGARLAVNPTYGALDPVEEYGTISKFGGEGIAGRAAGRGVAGIGELDDIPHRMNVSNIVGGRTNSGMSGLVSELSGKANGALSDVKGALRTGASNIHDAVSTAKAVGSEVAEAGAGVLDALGPVGDVLGVGLSIYEGVEASKEKAEEKEDIAEAQKQVSKPAPTPSAPTTNIALDTAGQAPMSAMSHY